MSNEDRRSKTIVIVATLDTRGDEVEFLKELIENKGHSVIAVDVGVMGGPHMPGDFTREEVAEAGGRSLQQLVEAADAGVDRQQATDVMIAGARKIVAALYSAGRLDGPSDRSQLPALRTGRGYRRLLPVRRAHPGVAAGQPQRTRRMSPLPRLCSRALPGCA